ncbi:MAG: mechanosensitive ion channel domain-containing protein [Candidatus Moraniibacteriota bacterium]
MKPDIAQVFIQQYLLSEQTARILTAVAVALIAYVFYTYFIRNWLTTLFREISDRRGIGKVREKQFHGWISLFEKAGAALILAVLVLTVLSELGYNITPVLTGAGILGIAIGLGSQNILKDILAGIFIFLEGHYRVGEKVKIAGLSGTVVKMTLRRTILRSEKNGSIHIVPNSEIKTITLVSVEEKTDGATGLQKKKSVLKD